MGLAPPLGTAPVKGLAAESVSARSLLTPTFPHAPCERWIRRWASPCSLAVTKGIPCWFLFLRFLCLKSAGYLVDLRST
ncbi:hypothetical protein JTE90_029155 [Oedothorax gibbosus]|uniref:Uncharacterized protein n=1 Tax=Oedothorax gibbosus TaxID=931172 RepID=A0AAV6THA2_9ARAC|nr:hypothetical protein JTE90_029155 [Oedothorax gibbosus]